MTIDDKGLYGEWSPITVASDTARQPSPAFPADDAGLVAALKDIYETDDHARGCEGRTYNCTCGFDDRTFATAKRAAEALSRREAELAEALKRERRRATDAEYMALAYRNMLGEKGRLVAALWQDRGVTRAHVDWGPEAGNLTGEERAQVILDMEKASGQPLVFGDGKGPRTKRSPAASQPAGGEGE